MIHLHPFPQVKTESEWNSEEMENLIHILKFSAITY